MTTPKKLFGAYHDRPNDGLKEGAKLPYLDGGYPGDAKDEPACNYDLRTITPVSRRVQ